MLTHLDFEPNFEFFKTPRNLYMEPLCVIDPEYGIYGQKYGVSAYFCRKLAFFGKMEA
jgi:hypothetical protein